MKVRILSGNETGTVKELHGIEAEIAIQTGYGELVHDPSPSEVAKVKAEAEMEGVMATESDEAMTKLVDELEAPERGRQARRPR